MGASPRAMTMEKAKESPRASRRRAVTTTTIVGMIGVGPVAGMIGTTAAGLLEDPRARARARARANGSDAHLLLGLARKETLTVGVLMVDLRSRLKQFYPSSPLH